MKKILICISAILIILAIGLNHNNTSLTDVKDRLLSEPKLSAIVRLVDESGATTCTGFVISDTQVVTAGHCVVSYEQGPLLIVDEDLKIAFIVNRQISGSKAKKEIKEILAGTGYKFFENSTNQRMDYINTIANGKTVFESSGKAKEEMTQIVNELMEFINDW